MKHGLGVVPAGHLAAPRRARGRRPPRDRALGPIQVPLPRHRAAARDRRALAAAAEGDRPMRINVTSVLVDDQDKALAFYTDVLGFVKKTDIPLGEPMADRRLARATRMAPSSSSSPMATRPRHRSRRRWSRDGIPYTSFAVDDVAGRVRAARRARRPVHAAADGDGPGDDRGLRRHLRQPHPDRRDAGVGRALTGAARGRPGPSLTPVRRSRPGMANPGGPPA